MHIRRWVLVHYLLTSCAATALLGGCGGAQPIAPPGAISQSGAAATYSMRPRHASGSSYQVVYNFAGGSDGARPLAGLIDVNGTLYGTTSEGGGSGCKYLGCGTVFSVTPSGKETVLHGFTGGTDGAYPRGALIAVKGTLYGTTFYGGDATQCGNDIGCGTVFSITPSGSENVLHTFTGPPDGAWPAAALIDLKGTLYGTTAEGGNSGGCKIGHPKIGCGSVYSITPSGSEKVLFRLVGPETGSYPVASLLDVKGTMYSTSEYGGGGHGEGSVYSVTTSGTGKLVYHFTYQEDVGEAPVAALIDVNGLLYSTLSSAGPHYRGTVYSITRAGSAKRVYSFAGLPDGGNPRASLLNVHGTLYGTTAVGGKSCSSESNAGCGTVFSVRKGGTEHVLHAFSNNGSDGYYPESNLINVNGTLYGTTSYGGTHGWGTVFAITP
jgi:uncharacterized repeat protein (TIGR03803 family)